MCLAAGKTVNVEGGWDAFFFLGDYMWIGAEYFVGRDVLCSHLLHLQFSILSVAPDAIAANYERFTKHSHLP